MKDNTQEKAIRSFFKREVDRVRIPEPPSHAGVKVERSPPWPSIQRAAATLLTAAAFTLLIMTAGRETPLSDAVDTALSRIDIQAEISGFFEEAGRIYRSGVIRR